MATAPDRLRLEVFSPSGGFADDWDIFVYPSEVSNYVWEMQPIAQVGGGWFTNRKLGCIFEARVGKGRLLASSVDLIEIKDRPAST